jgi:hypothetical protein
MLYLVGIGIVELVQFTPVERLFAYPLSENWVEKLSTLDTHCSV